MRFGSRSCVSILTEMSIAIMMSMPSTSRWLCGVVVCGRAKITTTNTSTNSRNTKGRCTKAVRGVSGRRRNDSVEATRNAGS